MSETLRKQKFKEKHNCDKSNFLTVVPSRSFGNWPSDGVHPTGRLESAAVKHWHVRVQKLTVCWVVVELLRGEVIG